MTVASSRAGRRLASVLELDAARETDEIASWLRRAVHRTLRRRGVVVGLSGGVDSSVTAALCVAALGRDRVLGILSPEAESAPESLALGRLVASELGISTVVEDITPTLEAVGCYDRRIEALRTVIPELDRQWRFKIALPPLLGSDGLRVFRVVARSPSGTSVERRLSATACAEVVAATNFKQRTRKMIEYHHADRLGYAVVGTPNRLEHDLGFFVKQGDGAADVKPIAHLYKSQVYALAEHLGIPEEVTSATPTTDTYSLPQTQEEFFFSLPFEPLDVCLWCLDHGRSAREAARTSGLSESDARRVLADLEHKHEVTRYLRLPPLVLDRGTPEES